MASTALPQFFPNDLQPIPIDEPTLRRVLDELRAAVRRGVELIQSHLSSHAASDISSERDTHFGTITSGSLGRSPSDIPGVGLMELSTNVAEYTGIALMSLRLEQQSHALSDFDHTNAEFNPPLPDFQRLAKDATNPNPLELVLEPGRPSPLCSPSLGASVIRILTLTHESDPSIQSPNARNDIAAIRASVEASIKQEPFVRRNDHSMGTDEVLLGRAGLLWALTDIERHISLGETGQALQPILELKQDLKDAIMNAGKKRSDYFAGVHGETDALPMMWPWINDYCALGACALSEDEYLTIGKTITGLCKISISNEGHLPMSMPPWSSSRRVPLVQMCHGTPGLILLLAAARGHPGLMKHRSAEWDEAIWLSSERVWEQGLLSKGGSLCHGIAGNAWPWLLLHERLLSEEHGGAILLGTEDSQVSRRGKLSADYFLSRALAFLLAARDTQPFAVESRYSMPNNPFGLFGGLAGTICAWAEACAVVKARLNLMEGQAEDDPYKNPSSDSRNVLGIPGLGGISYVG